jgi:hypothetical protein
MPAGQSNTTWFPKLKNLLKEQWKFDSTIEEHFELVKTLNENLEEIRKRLNVKPPTFWCKHCNERHESKMSVVTITSMYFALERFELCTHDEHLELKRNWRKYSKNNSINIYGKPIEDKKEERREHNNA